MKRTIVTLFVAGLCAGTTTAAFAQNVTAGEKPGASSAAKATDQKEMTNPPQVDHPAGTNSGTLDDGAAAFTKADKDNDGTLDKKEAKAMQHVSKNFDAIDADKDGTVSIDEIQTFMKAHDKAAPK